MVCHNCRVRAAKAGKRPDGMQRYRCGQCGKTFSDHVQHDNLCGHKQAVDDETVILALTMLVEGNSIRSTERITGVHRDTIIKLLVSAGARCRLLLERKVKCVPVTDVQCDEIWGFVGKKQANVKESERGLGRREGDAWTFIAIERHTKLVLAYELGSRHMEPTIRFIKKLGVAAGYTQFMLSTDGRTVYNYAVGMYLDGRCDYGQVIKIYQAPTPEEQRRYSPGKIAEVRYTPIYGDPDESKICTSHVERKNGSLRQWCKRLTRLTYAFSKKWENLEAALALHFAYYNFCRIHRTIKATPAMKAGLTGHPWTMAELLTA